ncbi:GIN domain-containing protein [Prevotella intermedia]|uniref:GIN domain-containing protein n=1 Tax=Prevotella intermedia TaxID=28131 RepID=UPI000BE7638C|nr:DUF2807 domain-containing protein [Prevotella intermedia]PDP69591.1 hypothetical protein CLI70_00050 [Prevotella intermedia]
MKKIFGLTFNVCLSILVFALLFTSCVHKKRDMGKVITKEIKVTPFQDLSLFSNSTVNIIPGDTFKVVVKGKEKLIANVSAKVENGVLTVSDTREFFSNRNELNFGNFTREDYFAEIYITMPTLRNIYQEGNSSININKTMTGDSIYIDMLGNSDLNIAGLTAKSLKMNVQGNASVDLAHLTVDRTNVDVLGNASMDLMFDLGGDVNLDIQGNASATLTGVTRNQPVYKMQGNGSVNDRTTRAQK